MSLFRSDSVHLTDAPDYVALFFVAAIVAVSAVLVLRLALGYLCFDFAHVNLRIAIVPDLDYLDFVAAAVASSFFGHIRSCNGRLHL